MDTLAPTVVFLTPQPQQTISGVFQVIVDAQDNRSISSVSLFVDSEQIQTLENGPYKFYWDTHSVSDGTHTLQTVAMDTAGNSESAEITVIVRNGTGPAPPSITSYQISPLSSSYIGSPISVSFSATAEDPDGGVVSYLWEFGDGQSSSHATVSHFYTSPGPNYAVRLTVTDDENQQTTRQAVVVIAELPILGSSIPFTLKDENGTPVKLSSLAGKVVTLNFWATWCVPCRQEFPDLEAAHQAHASEGFSLIGIDSLDLSDSTSLKNWHQQNQSLTYLLLLDKGQQYRDILDAYNLTFNPEVSGTLPYTVVMDRNHQVRFTKVGKLNPGELESILTKLLSFYTP